MTPDRPHVAYLFSRYPVVSQTFCDTEMLALEAAGFRLTAAALNPPPDSFRHERLDRLRAEVVYPPPASALEFPLRHPPDDPLWRAMEAMARDHDTAFGPGCKALTRARNAWHMARAFRRRGVDHVHVHFANRATHTAMFLKVAGLPFSFTAHAQDFMVDLANDDLLRAMIRSAEFVVAVSDFSRALLVDICPDAADRIVRVYNGIDAPAFPRADPGAVRGPLRVVSVGRLIPFKGFVVLLEAVGRLRQRKIDVDLQIVGDGPMRAALERQAEAASLAGCVRFRGVLSQDSIVRELAAADVFALACRRDDSGASDILPTVVLEAMACALPVVSTRLAGVPEMVLHGSTGLLAAPGDPDGLADCLAQLAADPAARAAMGNAGRRRVEEVFSLRDTAGKLGELFRTAAATRETRPEATRAAPSPPVDAQDVVCLLDSWPVADDRLAAEVDHLLTIDRCQVLAMDAGDGPSLPDVLEFLPDAVVLEAAWRAAPARAAAAEALRRSVGGIHGELFYRDARRAVFLAELAARRGWKRIHALRASSVLCAWLVHRIAGLHATATVESDHRSSRSVLARLLPDFAFGSLSDDRLRPAAGDNFPDSLQLHPPRRRRRFPFHHPSPPPQPDIPLVWRHWLDRNTHPTPAPPPI